MLRVEPSTYGDERITKAKELQILAYAELNLIGSLARSCEIMMML